MGSNYFLPYGAGEASAGVLNPVLGTAYKERRRKIGEFPKEIMRKSRILKVWFKMKGSSS